MVHFLSGQAGEGGLKRRTCGHLPVAPRGEQNTDRCADPAVTHTDAGPQEAVLFVCPVHTFMPLFLFYFCELIPVELLLTKKLKELAQFQVGFQGGLMQLLPREPVTLRFNLG